MARLTKLPEEQASHDGQPGKEPFQIGVKGRKSGGILPREKDQNITQHLEDKAAVEIYEMDQVGNIQRRWLHRSDNSITPVNLGRGSSSFLSKSLREWRKIVSDAFLPVGFPHSVSSDYLAYQTFDSLQAFFSTITSLLANRALLQGLGVGDANTSATYALLLTVLKDGMARVATIVFAHRFGLTIEPECKKYRFLADMFNDSAFFLDLLSPFLHSWAKAVALSVGEGLRALCGVAAGASKAALSSHFAMFDNLAELNAKEASQETAVGLCGLMVGTVVVRLVEGKQAVFWLVVSLVFVHLWMNYLGVRCVKLRTLNRQRATITFTEYFRTGRVLNVEEVSKRESIVVWRPIVKNCFGRQTAEISFAKSYYDAMGGGGTADIIVLEESGYSLFVWNGARPGYMHIKIMLWEHAKPEHAIAAWFHAMEIAWLAGPRGLTQEIKQVYDRRSSSDEKQAEQYDSDSGENDAFLRNYTAQWADGEVLRKLREAGWDTESSSFEIDAPIRLRVIVGGRDKKEQ